MNPRSVWIRFLRFGLAACLASSPACALVAGLESEAAVPTTIESEELEMYGSLTANHFTFSGKVQVTSDNMVMTCERLEVVSERSGPATAAIGQLGAIRSILARGDVVIRQAGREARAGQAEMDPQTGLLLLTESPRIIDGETVVSGWKIQLSRDRSIRVLPDPDASGPRQRATVTLGGVLPELNFDRPPPPPPPEPEWITDPEPDWVEKPRPTP